MQYLKLQYSQDAVGDARSALESRGVKHDVVFEKHAIDPALAEALVTIIVPVSVGLAQIVTAIVLNKPPKIIVIKDRNLVPSEVSEEELRLALSEIEQES